MKIEKKKQLIEQIHYLMIKHEQIWEPVRKRRRPLERE